MPPSWITKILGLFRRDHFGQATPSGAERRQHVRFDYSYSVTVLCGMKKFETTCSDISLGGMKLKHPLPPSMLGQQCRVSISDNRHKDTIVIDSKVISDSAVPRRISFSETDADSHAKLKEWLRTRYVAELKSKG